MKHFAYARTALKYGLKHFNFTQNDAILIPSYICDALVQPIKKLKIKITYYDLDSELNPIWENLETIIQQHSFKAIVIVHYFGQPQDLFKYKDLCQKYKILMIEDNAHGYGGRYNNKLLGTFGDIGISSPRKILNIFTGGILYLNGEKYSVELNRIKFNTLIMLAIKKILINISPFIKIYLMNIFKKTPNFKNPYLLTENKVSDMMADRFSNRIINKYQDNSLTLISKKRRIVWNMYMKMIKDDDLIYPLFPHLFETSSPWAFPVCIKNIEDRNKVVKKYLKKGIAVFPWPALPKEVLDKNDTVKEFWKKVICFPIY